MVNDSLPSLSPARLVFSRVFANGACGFESPALKYRPNTICFALMFQSPRPKYWSSLSGLGTAYVIWPHEFVAEGRYLITAKACGLNRLTGICAPGNGWPVVGFVIVLAFPFDWHVDDSSALKLPESAAAVGT